ncbi:MAG: hypothetical protein ACM3NI_11655 [Bacteroidota bacterium]
MLTHPAIAQTDHRSITFDFLTQRCYAIDGFGSEQQKLDAAGVANLIFTLDSIPERAAVRAKGARRLRQVRIRWCDQRKGRRWFPSQ